MKIAQIGKFWTKMAKIGEFGTKMGKWLNKLNFGMKMG